jgi:uncharacterized protein (TIGR02001 family)
MRYLILAAMLLSTPAFAQTSASITIGSDYMARGTSQTYNKPGVLVYAEHQFKSGVYVGGILANADFDDGTKAEADVVAGYRTSFGKYAVDVGGIAITYHGSQPTNWNMQEAHVSVSRAFGKVGTTAYVGWSPNYFNYGGHALWTEVSANYSPINRVTLNAGVARQSIARDLNYRTWNVGATYTLTPTLSASVKYYDTDWKPVGSKYIDKIYAPRVAVTLTKAF